MLKKLPARAGDTRDVGSIRGWRRSPGEGNGYPPPSILAWRIPWTKEPGGLQSIGSVQRVRHDWATNTLKSQWLTTAQICFSLLLSCLVWIDIGILLILITQGWDEKEVHLDTGFLNDPQNDVGHKNYHAPAGKVTPGRDTYHFSSHFISQNKSWPCQLQNQDSVILPPASIEMKQL